VYYYNGAQRYKQFLQVGWLYQALILLGLALCLPSASVDLVFMVLYILKHFFVTFLTFSWAEPGRIGPWPGWLLQYHDTACWVIWPQSDLQCGDCYTWPVISGLLHLVQWGGAWACCGPPSPLLIVPNVTAQQLVYQLHIIWCSTIFTCASKALIHLIEIKIQN